jgi:hypothetical protein
MCVRLYLAGEYGANVCERKEMMPARCWLPEKELLHYAVVICLALLALAVRCHNRFAELRDC